MVYFFIGPLCEKGIKDKEALASLAGSQNISLDSRFQRQRLEIFLVVPTWGVGAPSI